MCSHLDSETVFMFAANLEDLFISSSLFFLDNLIEFHGINHYWEADSH